MNLKTKRLTLSLLVTLVALLILSNSGIASPTAFFTMEPRKGNAPLTVEFNATPSTAEGERTIQEYEWYFEDHVSPDADTEITNHTFYELGENPVKLIVTDSEGETNSVQRTVEVEKPEEGIIFSTEAKDVGEGYTYLEAHAARYENGVSACRDVEVEAEFRDRTYTLEAPEDKTYCRYTGQIYTGKGEHEIEFTGKFPETDEYPAANRTEIAQVTVKGLEPQIRIYSPEEDAQKPVDSPITIEAGAIKRNRFIEGEFTAEINGEETQLQRKDLGTYRGEITPTETGEKTLTITFKDQDSHWEIQKQREINVLNETEADEVERIRKLRVIHPEPGARLDINETRYIMVNLVGEDGRPIGGQEVNYNIKRYDEVIVNDTIQQRDRLYVTSHKFSEPGEYTIEAYWQELKHSILLNVGRPEDIPEERQLKANIISPTPTNYAAKSEIRVIATTIKQEEYVRDANVTYILGDREGEMHESDRMGEWQANLGILDKGRHTLTVKATRDEETAIHTTNFRVTENHLQVTPTKPTPGQDLEVKEGNSINLKANVTDQNELTANNALVEATITSPEEKTSRTIMKQDPETGTYQSSYYPDTTGTYEIEIEAQKSAHVSNTTTFETHIEVEKETPSIVERIGKMDTRTLMNVALGVAIIILLLAIIHPLRFIF